MCGRSENNEGALCLLGTVTHFDSKPLSFCGWCYKWHKIREGTKVKRYV